LYQPAAFRKAFCSPGKERAKGGKVPLYTRAFTGKTGNSRQYSCASPVTNAKETVMKILIKLSSTIISEAIRSLLMENGLEAQKGSDDPNFTPDIILVDVNTVCDQLFTDFQEGKVLLLDTGIKKEKLADALLSYEISGIISADTSFDLFLKALTVIDEGRVWIDKSTIKSFLTEADLVTKKAVVRRRKAATGE